MPVAHFHWAVQGALQFLRRPYCHGWWPRTPYVRHEAQTSSQRCTMPVQHKIMFYVQTGLLVPTHSLESHCQPEPDRFAAKLCVANTSCIHVKYCHSGLLRVFCRFSDSADTLQRLQLSRCPVLSYSTSSLLLSPRFHGRIANKSKTPSRNIDI